MDVDVKYYADGEDGIKMEQDLVALAKELGMPPFKGEQSKKETSVAESKQEPASPSPSASKNKKSKKNKKK